MALTGTNHITILGTNCRNPICLVSCRVSYEENYLFGPLALSMTGFCVAQYQLGALQRAKEIKLLQDDRDAVRRRLLEYNLDFSNETSDQFSLGDESVEITYSSGTCDEDEEEVWDAPSGKAVQIVVKTEYDIKAEDLGLDLLKLEKEQAYPGVLDELVYHSKRDGIAVMVRDGLVNRVILFPAVNSKSKPCGNKAAKEFVSMKSWFGSKKLKDRQPCCDEQSPAQVTDVSLDLEEITATTPKEIHVSVHREPPIKRPSHLQLFRLRRPHNRDGSQSCLESHRDTKRQLYDHRRSRRRLRNLRQNGYQNHNN